MKILMTTDTIGGVWSYTVELARALGDYDAEILIAALGGPPSPRQREQLAGISGVELVESAFRLEWMEEPWDDVERCGEWLLRLADRFEPDVVHLNQFAHGNLPWAQPCLVVGHSCVLSWWQAVRGTAAPPEWSRYREAAASGLHAADAVVAPTRTMLDALASHYGDFPIRRVIPNGCDPARFQRAGKDRLILSAGRLWDEGKNIAALEQIAPQVRWPVWVAGATDAPDGGRLAVDHVRLLGPLDRTTLTEHLARAAIYALPARYEPFGLSILEAALSGCALVLGDIPSLREIWDEAALYVDPADPEALLVILNGLIADESLRMDLADRAVRRARHYSAAAMARAYMLLYLELALRQARRRSLQDAGVE